MISKYVFFGEKCQVETWNLIEKTLLEQFNSESYSQIYAKMGYYTQKNSVTFYSFCAK